MTGCQFYRHVQVALDQVQDISAKCRMHWPMAMYRLLDTILHWLVVHALARYARYGFHMRNAGCFRLKQVALSRHELCKPCLGFEFRSACMDQMQECMNLMQERLSQMHGCKYEPDARMYELNNAQCKRCKCVNQMQECMNKN